MKRVVYRDGKFVVKHITRVSQYLKDTWLCSDEVSDKEAIESLYYGMWFETTRELDRIKNKQKELFSAMELWRQENLPPEQLIEPDEED